MCNSITRILNMIACIIKYRTKETWENILNVALDEIRRRLHSAAALPPGNEPLYPLDKELGGSQSHLERGVSIGNRSPDSQVAVLI